MGYYMFYIRTYISLETDSSYSSNANILTQLELIVMSQILCIYFGGFKDFTDKKTSSNHSELQASEHPWMHFSTSASKPKVFNIQFNVDVYYNCKRHLAG